MKSIASRGRPRRFPKGDRKALWGERLSSPVATKRKPNESAETSGLWPRRLRLRTRPQARNLRLQQSNRLKREQYQSLFCKQKAENPSVLCDMESGGDLCSRAVSSQVRSALRGLTSVFGMGTGGTLSSLPPEMVSYSVAGEEAVSSSHGLPLACACFFPAFPRSFAAP